MLVYADMAIALPVAFLAIGLILALFHANQVYAVKSTAYEVRMLDLYSKSQLLTASLEATNANYSTAVSLTESFSDRYNISISILPYAENATCAYSEVCRLVALSGRLYVMVIE